MNGFKDDDTWTLSPAPIVSERWVFGVPVTEGVWAIRVFAEDGQPDFFYRSHEDAEDALIRAKRLDHEPDEACVLRVSVTIRVEDGTAKPFWAKCLKCGHIWPAAYYPIDLSRIAKMLMWCQCPQCGERKTIEPAKQDDGKLLESAA